MKNVLVSLYKGYGLGDAVKMSAVLRHLAKHRPDWSIDFQAEMGRYGVGRGIVSNVFAYGQSPPTEHYDYEFQITLYDRWYGFTDRPNTHVAKCLKEHFDIGWDAECARYSVDVSSEAIKTVDLFINPGEGNRNTKSKWGSKTVKHDTKTVAVHYQGDSAVDNKNLTHEQAAQICKEIEKLGHNPLLIDWRNTSPLAKKLEIKTTGGSIKSSLWGADAEINTAIISQCRAFVGIDSGPAKCASSTDTPSLVVWTSHHPAFFHDPAPNTTHLVPKDYHSIKPVCNDRGVVRWFEDNYNVRQYGNDPTYYVREWLEEVLSDDRDDVSFATDS